MFVLLSIAMSTHSTLCHSSSQVCLLRNYMHVYARTHLHLHTHTHTHTHTQPHHTHTHTHTTTPHTHTHTHAHTRTHTHTHTHTHMQIGKDRDWTQQLLAQNKILKQLSGLGTYDYNYLLALVFNKLIV